MLQKRPRFKTMWQHFSTVKVDVKAVGKIIGGVVERNIEIGIKDPFHGFTNACAIRMSYCLLHSGIVIPQGKWSSVSGRDKKQYIYRVNDMTKLLEALFGKPDKTVTNASEKDFIGMKGILVFNTQGWSNATGHTTLWDGRTCSDSCYFPKSYKVSIWSLK